MIYTFTTENLSVYEIDNNAGTWARLDHQDWSNGVRTETGELWEWHLDPWNRLVIAGPSLTPENDMRVITTSPILIMNEREES